MSSIQRLDVRTFLTLIFALLCSAWVMAAAPNNGYWQGFGGVPGCDGPVYASAELANGDLIFGGEFKMCDKVRMNNMGIYTPSTGLWRRVQRRVVNSIDGANGAVRAIAVSGTTVYVGGDFTSILGGGTQKIAAFNLANVQSINLGSGATGGAGNASSINALVISQGVLFAGGSFTTINGVSANYIARYDGSAWAPLGSGVNGTVTALAVSGSRVLVGGSFSAAGIAGAANVAEWSGDNWSAFGLGQTEGIITSVAFFNDQPYVGYRRFSGFNGALARWDGSAWLRVSGIEPFGAFGGVQSMQATGGLLYVAGVLTGNGGALRNVVTWNGAAFAPIGLGTTAENVDGPSGDGLTITVTADSVYVGGEFSEARTSSTARIVTSNTARFTGAQWRTMGAGNGMDGSVYALETFNNLIFAGGIFRSAGPNASRFVSAWNGSNWAINVAGSTGNGGPPYAFSAGAVDLYVGGPRRISSQFLGGVGRYDGATWQNVGIPPNSPQADVRAVAIKGSNLYVGGSFASIGGVAANNIARWDGTAWNALGAGVNGVVNTIEPAFAGNTILVGGQFTQAGGASANNIARWDGTATWSAIGAGVNGEVRAIQNLFLQTAIGGSFTSAGGVPANNIARLSGNTFAAARAGTSGPVNALAPGPDGFYAGGEFTTAGGLVTNNIARWSNTPGDWGPLGFGAAVGTDRAVRALALDGTTLYVGGDFVKAGDAASAHIAQFVIDPMAMIRTGFEGD